MPPVREIPKDYSSEAVERGAQNYWKENRIPEKASSRGERKYYFLDGPPYVTNPIHVGTAWNKILKDFYIRYLRMNGYRVRDQPGFDMHGLPIEVMVEKKIGIKSKKDIETLGIENFIKACRSFALENLGVATKQFRELGVWMGWDAPYRTLDNYYIESVWWLVKRAEERGLLAKGSKVVHWCPRCETVLAGYEATDEYREVEDRSIYVKFKVIGREGEYILVWTTTPWTLPANVAVMVNPNFTYARVRHGDEVYILAEERAEAVLGKDYEVIETFPGSDLSGLEYAPALLEEVPAQASLKSAHMVVLSDQYVTLEEGTGCVHTAPGHGEEDHAVGEAYGLPDFSPVDERGRFTADGGRYAGMEVREANARIIEDLRGKGLLFKEETTRHRYPHCWRCKTPLILRTASQWFIRVTELKERLLEENEKVEWIPEWAGRQRFGNWIKNAKDWVISRQRYWGIPLPIWVCGSCGRYEVIGSAKELREKALSDPGDLELHRPWVDRVEVGCRCGGSMRRISDVADVWMDSGSASFAVLHYPSDEGAFRYWWPVDLVLEGHDQTRGWFYTLMVCGVIAFDSSPYRRVVMHGFTIDQDGRAMHKSLGNVVYPEEVIGRYGRDALRWYELGCTTWEDLKFTWKSIEESARFINILWSTYYFASLYMSLDQYSPERYPLESVAQALRPEDRWILSRFERAARSATLSFREMRVFEGVRTLEEFMKEEMSRWYVKLIRKRTWSEKEDPDKMAAYATLHHVLFNYLRMVAPIIPFTAEEIYRKMFMGQGMPESVHLLEWPKAGGEWSDERLEREMEIAKDLIEASYSARQSAGIKIRQPLLAMKVVTKDDEVGRAVADLRGVILEQTNVKSVDLMTPDEEEEMKEVSFAPNFAALGPVFRERSGKVGELIAGLDRPALDRLRAGGTVEAEADFGRVELRKEFLNIQERLPENFKGAKSRFATVYVDTKKSRELIAEGTMRDVVRRIQEMRKKADLKVDAYISVRIHAPTEEARGLLEGKSREIASEVRAKRLEILAGTEGAEGERWEIEGEEYVIDLEEA